MESPRHTYNLRRALRPSRRARDANPAVGNRVDRRGRPRPIRIRLMNRVQAPENNPRVIAEARLRSSLRYIKTYCGPLSLYSIFDRVEQRYLWHWNTDRARLITQFWGQADNILLGMFDKDAGEFLYRHPRLPEEYQDACNYIFGPIIGNANIAMEGQSVANLDAANNAAVEIKEEPDDEA